MVPNRGDRNERRCREGSHLGSNSRHSHTLRNKRDRHDQKSIDSGYEGSSAAFSPRSAKHAGSEGVRSQDADQGRDENDTGHDTESDTDYDPKARCYLNIGDRDYQNITFQSGEFTSAPPESSKATVKRTGLEDKPLARRRQSNHNRRSSSSQRHRSITASPSGSDSDSSGSGGHSRQKPTNRYADSSRPRSRQGPSDRALSPVLSDISEDWRGTPERRMLSTSRSVSRRTRRRRASSADSSGLRARSADAADTEPQSSSDESPRPRARKRIPTEKGSQRKVLSEGGSSSYKGAADLDDAWYKTFKERLTKGVDMNQVKKVGLDAAAVAAVKVAVGTQIPWKQRIPKTIAVGLAAAVTDFLVSKTSFKPKGMVGTMYMRQFVEIALANLIINPTSNKVNQRIGGAKAGQGGGQGAMKKLGTQSSAVGASRGSGGKGRR